MIWDAKTTDYQFLYFRGNLSLILI